MGDSLPNERPKSLGSMRKDRQSRIPSKEGELASKKFAGMKNGMPTWEDSWSPARLKVFNGKLRLEQGDRTKPKESMVAWEMSMQDIKLITPANQQGEFFLTAKHDGVKLVSMGHEDVGAQIMRGVQEMDLIGSSQQDLVFVFKTDKTSADEWVSFLDESMRAFAEVGGPTKDPLHRTQSLSDELGAFKSGSIMRARGRGRKGKGRGKGKGKAKGRANPNMTEVTTPVFTRRKKAAAGPLDPLLGVLRLIAVVFSVVAVCSVGPFYAAFLVITNASRREKREYANTLQEVLTQGIIWILPSYALHISGEAPTSYVNDAVYDDSGKAQAGEKGSSKAKIFVLNRCSHADFLTIALLANEIDHSGHLRAILRGRKRIIQYVPFVGTMFTWFRFMFLSGRKRADEPIVHSYMKKLSKERAEWLVFFPEPGPTPITQEAIKKSKKTAEEVGRPVLEKVLLPNASLLETCLMSLGASLEDHQDAEVYDITLAYSGYVGEYGNSSDPFGRKDDNAVPSIYSLLFNSASRDFHVHSKVYSLRELLETIEGGDGLEVWLDERFQQKDERLEYFAQHQTFVNPHSGDENDSKAEVVESHGSISRMLYLWAATAALYIGVVVLLIVLLLIRSRMG